MTSFIITLYILVSFTYWNEAKNDKKKLKWTNRWIIAFMHLYLSFGVVCVLTARAWDNYNLLQMIQNLSELKYNVNAFVLILKCYSCHKGLNTQWL
jgi:hypothetical protein